MHQEKEIHKCTYSGTKIILV